jgi:arsenate reductase (glutaredoxin)
MGLTIYHNPRCSKSRQTLEIIREAGVEPDIVRYLDDTPSPETILALAAKLGQPVADLLRRKESEFRTASDLPELDDNEALARWLADHPKVIERPIVVDGDSGRAVLGRPPENVKALLS